MAALTRRGGTTVLTEERREALRRLVERRGSIKVKDVAEEMGVSAVTVRQDVRELAGRGWSSVYTEAPCRRPRRRPRTWPPLPSPGP